MRSARIVATFSIVGADPDTGDLGVAVASKFLAVGHVVPWARLGVGAVATQALANVRFGPRALVLMSRGLAPGDVIMRLVESDPKRDHRQIGIVNKKGEAASYTGSKCMAWAGHVVGDRYAVQGNLLVGEQVINAMASAFEKASGELVDKLIAALEAGDRAGGDRRGRQSAALIVLRRCGGYGGCREGVGRYVDIRVDDHQDPVAEVKRIFGLWSSTLIVREDLSSLVELEKEWQRIALALKKLGYLRRMPAKPQSPSLRRAFKRWAEENNLENKLRRDSKIWGSVFKQLLRSAGLEG